MNKLVYLDRASLNAEPFTTSAIVAEAIGIRHDKIKAAIAKHKAPLETFGKLTPYGGGLGGRGNESGYQLNEQQATLLITFLKNTPVVIAFKTELVRQFYTQRAELMRRRTARAEGKPIRRQLTDVIRERHGDNPWAYKKYTDLAYKTALGQTAVQIRKARGAEKRKTAADFLASDELAAVHKLEDQITVLLELGMDYLQIKEQLAGRYPALRVAQ